MKLSNMQGLGAAKESTLDYGIPTGCIDCATPFEQTVIAKRGDKTSAARAVQQLLADIGLPVQPDGIFGPQTEAAVKLVQQKFVQSGAPAASVGPPGVWTQGLSSVYNSQFRVVANATPEDIASIQRAGGAFVRAATAEENARLRLQAGTAAGSAMVPVAPQSQTMPTVSEDGTGVPGGDMPSGGGYMPGQPMTLLQRLAQRLNVPPMVIAIGGGVAALGVALIGYNVIMGAASPSMAIAGLHERRPAKKKKRRASRRKKK